jgi:ABC-type transport system substrate-binding protein
MTSWTLLKVIAAASVLIGLHPALGKEREPLVIAQGGGPTTLDPLKEQAGPMQNVWTQIFDGLTRRSALGEIVRALGVYQKNDKFDRLTQEGSAIMETSARKAVYNQATELMREEAPAAFLVQLPAVYSVNNNISGFVPRSDERWDLTSVSFKN